MVTGFTKAAILGGRFMAGATGQLLVSFRLMDLRELNYITLVGTFTTNITIPSGS